LIDTVFIIKATRCAFIVNRVFLMWFINTSVIAENILLAIV